LFLIFLPGFFSALVSFTCSPDVFPLAHALFLFIRPRRIASLVNLPSPFRRPRFFFFSVGSSMSFRRTPPFRVFFWNLCPNKFFLKKFGFFKIFVFVFTLVPANVFHPFPFGSPMLSGRLVALFGHGQRVNKGCSLVFFFP